jgi:hypothetical protein
MLEEIILVGKVWRFHSGQEHDLYLLLFPHND